MFFAIVAHFRSNRHHFHHGEIREDCFRRVRVNKRSHRLQVCTACLFVPSMAEYRFTLVREGCGGLGVPVRSEKKKQ